MSCAEETIVTYTLLNRFDLTPAEGTGTAEFEGYLYGSGEFSFLWVEMEPDEGVRLHKHPYEEVFIILEGRPLFTVGGETLEGQAGQIVIVPPETPHKFANVGEGRLRQVDIHASNRFITVWLE